MKIRVTLSIGFPTATHEAVLDVCDEAYASCENDSEREDLLGEHWSEWSNNYIDGGYEILETPLAIPES